MSASVISITDPWAVVVGAAIGAAAGILGTVVTLFTSRMQLRWDHLEGWRQRRFRDLTAVQESYAKAYRVLHWLMSPQGDRDRQADLVDFLGAIDAARGAAALVRDEVLRERVHEWSDAAWKLTQTPNESKGPSAEGAEVGKRATALMERLSELYSEADAAVKVPRITPISQRY